jgi:hypothetical protein
MKKYFMKFSVRLSVTTLLLFAIILVCSAGAPREAWAYHAGISGYSGNPATHSGLICNDCHSGGTTPTVVLTGPTTLAPNASDVYTLTITGGAASVGGLDVSTTAGTLQATGSNTQLMSGEVTHTDRISFASGSLVFTFTLVAPSSGSITLYAAGLSANGSGSSGDKAAATTLAVTVASASAPQIVVTDSVAPPDDHQIPFGTITNGLTSDQTVTITNSGDADLVIGTIASGDPLAAPFSITADPCSGQTIAPAGTCSLTVRFAPTAATLSNDSFDIPSNDSSTGTVTVSLSGTGTAALMPNIIVTDSVAPSDDHQIPFGTVNDGLTSEQSVTITNSGDADLIIGTIAGGDPLAAPFSITADPCSGQTIAPAGTCSLTVRFAPTAATLSNDSFDIPSNDPDMATVTINVSGTGTAANAPIIAVADSVAPSDDLSIPFGNWTAGITSDQTVTITNNGNSDLVIGNLAAIDPLAVPFSITADTCSGQTIPSAGTCSLTVRFAPTSAAIFSDSFDIPSNDPGTPSVTMNVSGTGLSSATNNSPSSPTLVSPLDGQTGVDTTVTFQWNKSADPDNDPLTYHLSYCPGDPSASCTPVDVASNGMPGIFFAGSGLLFLGFVFTHGSRGKKLMLMLMIVMLLMTGALFTSCGKDSETSTSTTSSDFSQQVSGLNSATTYYWKVVADDGKGGLAPSDIRSFTTQ